MNFGRWLGLIALVAALLLLWSLRGALVLVFTSVVLAMAFCTLIGAVRNRLGCSRLVAMALSLVGVLLLTTVVVTVIIPPFVEQFSELIRQLPKAASMLLELFNSALSNVSRMVYGTSDGGVAWLKKSLSGYGENTAAIASGLGGGALRLVGLAGNVGTGLVQTLFVVAVAVMITAQPHAYRDAVLMMVPSFYRRRARQVLLQCGDALSGWMVGVLISSLCVGVLAGIGLSLLGVELVAANAMLAGLLNIIPNVGPTLSTVFPMAVALLAAPWKALAVLVLYVVVQQLESYLITPSVMQHQLNLLPGLTLTAQFVFTVLFGPLGLILALPLAVCLQVILREVVIHDILDRWKPDRFGPERWAPSRLRS